MARLDGTSWEQLVDAELSAADTSEDGAVEDFGIEYESWEELHFGDEHEAARDRCRWELDPASAEDFRERNHGVRLALRWRHFGM